MAMYLYWKFVFVFELKSGKNSVFVFDLAELSIEAK